MKRYCLSSQGEIMQRQGKFSVVFSLSVSLPGNLFIMMSFGRMSSIATYSMSSILNIQNDFGQSQCSHSICNLKCNCIESFAYCFVHFLSPISPLVKVGKNIALSQLFLEVWAAKLAHYRT